jgi:hypothetical protein
VSKPEEEVMFNPSTIGVEADYQRQEMLRQAEHRRLIRVVRQSEPRRVKRLNLNALLSAIRPVEVEPAPRIALKSR